MTENGTSRSPRNGSLKSEAIGAAPGDPPPVSETAPTPAPMAPHGHTLQFVISIIKKSQQTSPLQQSK